MRVRETVLPTLEAQLGPGIAEALARSAEQSREDGEALDDVVAQNIDEVFEIAEGGVVASVDALAGHPAAIRNRIIRRLVLTEFDQSLSSEHTRAVAALVTDWHGQHELHLPGIRVQREGRGIVFRPANNDL